MNSSAVVNGHEATLLSRFLNDETAIERYPDLKAEHFASPVHREIFEAILMLHYDGRETIFPAVEDCLRSRGRLPAIGEHTISTLAADNRITAMDESCFAYAVERVRDSYAEREATRIGDDLAAGEITADFAREKLEQIRKSISIKPNWLANIDTSTVRSSELAAMELSSRKPLLGEWLCEGDYGIIFAPRGVGKTWLGLLITKAVATGGRVGEWEAPEPAKTFYIDGEMPADLMRDRDCGLGSGEVEFLNHSILFDRTEKILNITETAVQEAILGKCIRDEIKLLVLDNLSVLASGIKENDSFEWERLHNWLLQFRRHKIAVILIHHAGRSGEIRGTSKREDAAFWCLALDDAKKNADDKRGARFISRFTKPSRNTQHEVLSYEWHVVTEPVTGVITVACKPAQTQDVFRHLIEDGVTECGQIADEMRVSPATISRMAKKAIDQGWLRKKGREYEIVKGDAEVK
jgi:putative DNA primase/helicase